MTTEPPCTTGRARSCDRWANPMETLEEALLDKKLADSRVLCRLCPQECGSGEGQPCTCGVIEAGRLSQYLFRSDNWLCRI
jgi:hypothetical protein